MGNGWPLCRTPIDMVCECSPETAISIQFTKWKWSRIFQSCIFSPAFSGPAFSGPGFSYPGNLLPHFPVVLVALWFNWSLTGPSFSGSAFSVDPKRRQKEVIKWRARTQTDHRLWNITLDTTIACHRHLLHARDQKTTDHKQMAQNTTVNNTAENRETVIGTRLITAVMAGTGTAREVTAREWDSVNFAHLRTEAVNWRLTLLLLSLSILFL